MDPAFATYVRNNSLWLLALSLLIWYAGVQSNTGIKGVLLVPVALCLIGTLLILTRYRHFS